MITFGEIEFSLPHQVRVRDALHNAGNLPPTGEWTRRTLGLEIQKYGRSCGTPLQNSWNSYELLELLIALCPCGLGAALDIMFAVWLLHLDL